MKRVCQLLCGVIALLLEALTKGAVLVMSPGPGKYVREMYSYFNPVTFGNANFPPLITAILTCAVLILGLIALKKRKAAIALIPVSVIAFAVSLLPLLYGIRYYSLIGAGISLALGLSAFFAIYAMVRKKPPQAAPNAPGWVPPPPPPPQRPQ